MAYLLPKRHTRAHRLSLTYPKTAQGSPAKARQATSVICNIGVSETKSKPVSALGALCELHRPRVKLRRAVATSRGGPKNSVRKRENAWPAGGAPASRVKLTAPDHATFLKQEKMLVPVFMWIKI